MAEEGKKVEEDKNVDTSTDGKEDAEGGQEDAAPVELSATEQLAKAQGWVPLDEWKGDPKDHRSAREFVDRGELLTKIKSQSNEIQAVTKVAQQLSEHNKLVYQAGIEAGIKQLKEQRREALKEGDFDTVTQIEDKLEQRQGELAIVKATPTPNLPKPQVAISPEFQTFLDRNPWYAASKSKQHYAHGLAIEYARDHTNATEKQVYDFVEGEAKKDFPDLFKARREGPPSLDGEGRRTSGTGGGNSKGNSKAFEDLIASMPEDQARVAKDMVKRGYVTKEKYVEDYNSIGGR